MSLSWVLCDFVTGLVLTDLADVTAESPLRLSIGQYEQNVITLPLPTAPAEWLSFTRPWTANFVALDEQQNPVWGGPIIGRPRDETDSIAFPVATAEAYFTKRYVAPATGVLTYTGTNQSTLAGDLVSRFILTGSKPGMPIRINPTASALARTITYNDTDDITVYSALQSLSSMLGGSEWYVSWEWQQNPGRITPVFNVADRMGSAARTGIQPNALFTMPGNVSSFGLDEDYSDGNGANDITVIGSGQGLGRPSSRAVATNLAGRPTIELRTPITGDDSALSNFAAQALAYKQNGAQSLTLTADAGSAPKYGTDWTLGDDVGYEVGGTDLATGQESVPAFPGGVRGTARAIAVERTDTTIAPILWTLSGLAGGS